MHVRGGAAGDESHLSIGKWGHGSGRREDRRGGSFGGNWNVERVGGGPSPGRPLGRRER